MNDKKQTIILGSVFLIIALFSAAGFFLWTLIPNLQGREYIAATKVATDSNALFDNNNFIFHPDSSEQGLIRMLLVVAIMNRYNTQKLTEADTPLVEKALSGLTSYVEKHPYNYDYMLLIARVYDAEADVKNTPALRLTAEEYYKKALALAPGRQDVIYTYAINLMQQGRTAEAVAMLKASLAQTPGLPAGEYQLGQALAVQGENQYAASLDAFEIALAGGVNPNPSVTLELYEHFFYYFYHQGDIVHLQTAIKRLAVLDPSQKEKFQGLADFIEKNHVIPSISIALDR